MPSWSVQFMGDIVQPASKDAGGIVHGTVTDLKDQVSMPSFLLKCLIGFKEPTAQEAFLCHWHVLSSIAVLGIPHCCVYLCFQQRCYTTNMAFCQT